MEFLLGLLFLACLTALVAFVLLRALTQERRDAALLAEWAAWARRRGFTLRRGGARRRALCTAEGRHDGVPMTLELLREDGAPYRVVVRAAASERRGLTFLCVAPPGAPAALSPSWQKRPVEDAAFGYAFDVYTEELAVPVALDERLRQALLRFPRPLLGPPVRFAYDAAEATLSWPVGGAPEDAAIDAALAVVAVACPVTPAARRRMN